MEDRLKVLVGSSVKLLTQSEMGKTDTNMDHIGMHKDWFVPQVSRDVTIPAIAYTPKGPISGEARITWKKNTSPTAMLNGARSPQSIAHFIIKNADEGSGIAARVEDDRATFLLISARYMNAMGKKHTLTREDIELVLANGDPAKISQTKQGRIEYSESDNALAFILYKASSEKKIELSANNYRLITATRETQRPYGSWTNRVRNFLEAEKYFGRRQAAADPDSIKPGFTGGIEDKYQELERALGVQREAVYASAAKEFKSLTPEQEAFFISAGFNVTHFKKQNMKESYEQRLICALAAKPFVILAGGTGTGKTKSAIETVKKLCKLPAGEKKSDQFEVIAVGADWTDTRPLLGYVNLLIENGPAYSAPAALQLILRAHKNKDLPFFLILDEMNLSHVERYFSDFLSLMEAKKIDKSAATIKLHSQTGDMKAAEAGTNDVPAEVPWPTNLYVIGTVNIDETTHMFSPKVLDRAHVIEYKVEWKTKEQGQRDILSGLDQMVAKGDMGAEDINYSEAIGPILVKSPAERLKGIDTGPMNDCKTRIEKIWNRLNGTRFAFSHRTTQEAIGYVLIASALGASEVGSKVIGRPSTNALIDLAVLQKILPKINGSAETLSLPREETGKQETNLLEQLKVDCEGLPGCEEKLTKMMETLKREHFVSFIQ